MSRASRGVPLAPGTGAPVTGPPATAPPGAEVPAAAPSRPETIRRTPSDSMASGSGWKNVVPPRAQSPLPPEVTPSARPSENSGPPLSPGSAHTSVSMRPVTLPSG